MFKIIDLTPTNETHIAQTAQILFDAFRENWADAWSTLEEATEEVEESFEEGRISRIAVDENGDVLGWIGGLYEYASVWELHPLAIAPDKQGMGIGQALVADLERLVAERGGITLRLGSDDENEMTSLSGIDLYAVDLGEAIANIQNYKNHPYSFYEKLGYKIVGVIPDANGFGKPDIMMAKRVGTA